MDVLSSKSGKGIYSIRSPPMSDVIEHKCVNCGASLVFNPVSQTMICPYCGVLTDVYDTRKNDRNLRSKKENISKWSYEELQYINEYQCISCGGDIYTDDTTAATLCPYCGNAVILRGRLSGTLRPNSIVPFQITKEQAISGLDDFIGTKHFVNRDFIGKRKLDEVKGLYVPFWIYDADVSGDMIFRCVNESVWTKGNYEYTERRYYEARRIGNLRFHNLPVTASSKISPEMMESIEPFNQSKSTGFLTGYLSGYVADKYDIEDESAFTRAEQRMSSSIESELEGTLYYDEVNVIESDIDVIRYNSSYVLYPVWLLSSIWNGKVFSFAMNGQTGKMAGNLPVSRTRLLALFAFVSLVFAGFFSIISLLANGQVLLMFVIPGLVIGMVMGIVFVSSCKKDLVTVQLSDDADRYSDHLDLRKKEDHYLYKEVTKRKIYDDDDD